jgi:glutamyl-tRNA synthetase
MGDLHFSSESVDDFILIKSDGYPTYNFAHIVDDLEMKITHVIRGQEFISSVPNYLNLYEALNEEPPILATMPHILAAEGNKKLSKRDGAKDVLDYISEGYLPNALISFIATLGWNDGTTQEIFTREELIEKFDLSKVQRSGAKFDDARLKWINGSLIRQTDINELYDLCENYWPEEAKDSPKEHKSSILKLIQERLKYLSELSELSKFFFTDLAVDESLISSNNKLKSISKEELKSLLETSLTKLEASDFSVNDLTNRLNQLLEDTNQKPAILFSLIRIATTQAPASPPLAETIAVLGKETVIRRLKAQIEALV